MVEMCARCGAEFGSAADLLDHEKSDHGLDPKHVADPAPMAPTPTGEGPETRRRRPFVCGTCGEMFTTRSGLSRHNLEGRHTTMPGTAEPA